MSHDSDNVRELTRGWVDEWVRCLNCWHRYLHVRPAELGLERLECPACGLTGPHAQATDEP